MFPQITLNVKVNDKNTVVDNTELKELIEKISAELSDNGRILVRPSGTEPVVRIMVEASDYLLCQKYSKTVEGKILSLEV